VKTKCPYCDNGCDRCEDGFFDSPLGDGLIFSEHCSNEECQFVNGIWVVREDNKLPTSRRRCVMCNWETEWELFGWSAPDPYTEDDEEDTE